MKLLQSSSSSSFIFLSLLLLYQHQQYHPSQALSTSSSSSTAFHTNNNNRRFTNHHHVKNKFNRNHNDLLMNNRSLSQQKQTHEYLKSLPAFTAEKYLMKMEEPDVFYFNTVMCMYARQGHAKKVEDLLEQMSLMGIKPTAASYSTLIRAWSRSSSSQEVREEKINEILDEMSTNQIYPDVRTYGVLLSAWKSETNRDQNITEWKSKGVGLIQKMYSQGIQPNAFCFSIIIDAYASQGMHAAAEELMKSIQDDGIKLKKYEHVVLFCSLLKAYAKAGKPAKAHKMLLSMLPSYKLRPSTRCYTVVIQAWNKANKPEKAQELLDSMISSGVTPDIIVYTAVINSFARNGRLEEAEQLLTHLEELYESTNDRTVRPDQFCYTALIDAYGKAGNAIKARRTFDRMTDAYAKGNKKCRPNIQSFTAVINACAAASSEQSEEAMQIATYTFEELQASGYCRPNHITYGTLLKTYISLLKPHGTTESEQQLKSLIEFVFQSCKEQGLVDRLFIIQLQRAVSKEYFREIVGADIVNKDSNNSTALELPKEWTCNIQL